MAKCSLLLLWDIMIKIFNFWDRKGASLPRFTMHLCSFFNGLWSWMGHGSYMLASVSQGIASQARTSHGNNPKQSQTQHTRWYCHCVIYCIVSLQINLLFIPVKRDPKKQGILHLCLPFNFLIFFFLFIYLSFMWYILTTASPPPLLPVLTATSLLPPDSLYPHFPSEKAGFPVISAEHSITRCTETKHKPSYQSWTRQSGRRKRIQKQNQRH